jgi:hypothetical protein
MDVIGTSPRKATVEPSREQRSRIESGTEIENNVRNSCRDAGSAAQFSGPGCHFPRSCSHLVVSQKFASVL